MTTIIALKFKNGFLMAADNKITYGNNLPTSYTKIVEKEADDKFLCIGHSGDVKNGVIINDSDFSPDSRYTYESKGTEYVGRKSYFEYLNTVWGPELFELLDKYGCVENASGVKKVNSDMLIGITNKYKTGPFTIFMQTLDLVYLPINQPFYAVGSGSDFALGYLHAAFKSANILECPDGSTKLDIEKSEAVKIVSDAIQVASLYDRHTGCDCKIHTYLDAE